MFGLYKVLIESMGLIMMVMKGGLLQKPRGIEPGSAVHMFTGLRAQLF